MGGESSCQQEDASTFFYAGMLASATSVSTRHKGSARVESQALVPSVETQASISMPSFAGKPEIDGSQDIGGSSEKAEHETEHDEEEEEDQHDRDEIQAARTLVDILHVSSPDSVSAGRYFFDFQAKSSQLQTPSRSQPPKRFGWDGADGSSTHYPRSLSPIHSSHHDLQRYPVSSRTIPMMPTDRDISPKFPDIHDTFSGTEYSTVNTEELFDLNRCEIGPVDYGDGLLLGESHFYWNGDDSPLDRQSDFHMNCDTEGGGSDSAAGQGKTSALTADHDSNMDNVSPREKPGFDEDYLSKGQGEKVNISIDADADVNGDPRITASTSNRDDLFPASSQQGQGSTDQDDPNPDIEMGTSVSHDDQRSEGQNQPADDGPPHQELNPHAHEDVDMNGDVQASTSMSQQDRVEGEPESNAQGGKNGNDKQEREKS